MNSHVSELIRRGAADMEVKLGGMLGIIDRASMRQLHSNFWQDVCWMSVRASQTQQTVHVDIRVSRKLSTFHFAFQVFS